MWYTYQELSKVEGGEFTVAAAFGNVHGVYAPGNVRLTPQILHDTQSYIKEKLGCDTDKPVKFVFHGGSGSSTEDIRYAIKAGTIKMNIDTDTQWAFWDGIRSYEAKNRDYLQGQIGNDGESKPTRSTTTRACRCAGRGVHARVPRHGHGCAQLRQRGVSLEAERTPQCRYNRAVDEYGKGGRRRDAKRGRVGRRVRFAGVVGAGAKEGLSRVRRGGPSSGRRRADADVARPRVRVDLETT